MQAVDLVPITHQWIFKIGHTSLAIMVARKVAISERPVTTIAIVCMNLPTRGLIHMGRLIKLLQRLRRKMGKNSSERISPLLYLKSVVDIVTGNRLNVQKLSML